MAKSKYKQGDIFEVITHDGSKKGCFQYLLDDHTGLSANVIRVFNYQVDASEDVDIDEAVESGIDFYKQTVIQGGVKLKVWRKIGNRSLEPSFKAPWFRRTPDVYSKVKKSNKWVIWQADGQEREIGKLADEHRKLPIGAVSHPFSIIEQIETGSDGFKHPE